MIWETSRKLHDLLYRDASQSLCARAWGLRHTSSFWALWVRIFGPAHCRKSWEYYHADT